MRRRYLTLAVAFAAALFVPGLAVAHPGHGPVFHDPVDGPAETSQAKLEHPGGPGHLPPGSRNMQLVGKLRLTNVEGGIADVGVFGNFAYLNAFSPECKDRGGAGTGVHVVDISNPASPSKAGFIAAHENSYVGEGIHVVHASTPSFTGDLLIHNNETCDASKFAPSGASLWDVTDPRNPKPMSLNFGDPDPAVDLQTYHTTHSAQLFVQPGALGGKDRILATLQDNQDLDDVDIFDVSNPKSPVLLSEQGLEDWPGAQGSYANGDTVFHHDMQHKRIGGHDYLLVSYWDAGQVLLNIDDPANPTFVGDSDYRFPDPLMPQFDIPEGNSHQAYWDADSEFILSTDEDFSPFRTLFQITTGPNAGPYGAGEFGWTVPIDSRPDKMINGPTVFGGRGCDEDPPPPPASSLNAGPGEEKIVVMSRGACFFSIKVENAQDAGYDAVIIGQSHGGSRNGLLPDSFFCGGQGHEFTITASGVCVGHRAMHLLFSDDPAYTGPDGPDIPLGALGERVEARTVFDGWGYVQLHDARDPNLKIIDSYAVPEALDHEFAEGFGVLSVHEVKTDPRTNVNLAYISYYNAGARVVKFDRKGIKEVGFFIDEGGNHFWGTFPFRLGKSQGAPYLAFSDRDSGLYILRYTGD
jgi:PA domain/LVIVD repeat